MRIGVAGPIESETIAALLGGTDRVVPKGYGSGAPLFGTLIGALLDRGHQVYAFTTDASLYGGSAQRFVAVERELTLHYCPVRPRAFRWSGGRPGRMADMFRFERQELVRAIRSEALDVIHGHWTYEFGWAAIDSGVPHVVTAHDSPWEVVRHTRNLYRLGRYMMALYVIRKARLLTAVGPTVRADIGGWATVPVSLVANPVPEAVFSSYELHRATEGKGVVRRIVMVLNGWSEFKNPIPALQAFSVVRKRCPAVELHCYGAGFGSADSGPTWARSRGLGDGVYFHGPRPHGTVLERVAEASLLLHPSRLEACSMAVAEAMSMGVPVIGGRLTGGVAWQLEGGKAGVLVDVDSPLDIATAVLGLLSNPERAEEVGRAGRSRAKDLFSVDRVVGQYEEAYHSAVRKSLVWV